MTLPPTKLYIASKFSHAQRWLDLWSSHPRIHLVSRWPALVVAGIKESPEWAGRFWEDDLADVARADAILCYGAPGENLRGALVEVGAALALGKPVYLAGENENFGTWQYHPRVCKHRQLDLALAAVEINDFGMGAWG